MRCLLFAETEMAEFVYDAVVSYERYTVGCLEFELCKQFCS